MSKTLAGALAGLLLAMPLPAPCRDVSSNQAVDGRIDGRVTGFHGGYALSVVDANGKLESILLHQGTIINPNGLTLAPGMLVRITGYPAGKSFAANEIDTPYQVIDGFTDYAGRLWDNADSGSSADVLGGSDWWRAPHGGDNGDGRRGGRGGGDHGGGADHGGGGGGDHAGGGGDHAGGGGGDHAGGGGADHGGGGTGHGGGGGQAR